MKLHYLEETDSTQAFAWRLIRDEAPDGVTAILSNSQNDGKGQRGTVWQSTRGAGIYLSLVFRDPEWRAGDLFKVNKALSVVLLQWVNRIAPSSYALKWPNDLYWNDRKLGGLLIESQLRGTQVQWLVAGIGINLNQLNFRDELNGRAASLRQIAGECFDASEMGIKLAESIAEFMLETGSMYGLAGRYNDYLYRKGEWGRLSLEGEEVQAKVIGVDDEGALIYERDGEIHRGFHPRIRILAD